MRKKIGKKNEREFFVLVCRARVLRCVRTRREMIYHEADQGDVYIEAAEQWTTIDLP